MIRLSVRHLRAEDLPLADQLRELAGWNQTMADWEWICRSQPDGCLGGEIEGRLIATAVCLRYSEGLGWIGMMLVHPDFRRRGIGGVMITHCLEHFRRQGVACVKLDATPEGKAVYTKFGFAEELGLTRWSGGPFPERIGLREGRAVGESDLPQVQALDHAASGIAGNLRLELLRHILAPAGEGVLVDHGPQEPRGFGAIRAGSRAHYLGPVVATEPTVAGALADSLMAGKGRVFCDIPDRNTDAVEWARSRGLSPERRLTRMRLGKCPDPAAPRSLFMIAAPEFG